MGTILLTMVQCGLQAAEKPRSSEKKKQAIDNAANENRKTPREPEWLPVRELRADFLPLEFSVVEDRPGGGERKVTRKQAAVSLRAVFPYQAQVEQLASALPGIVDQDPGDFLELFDFEIERQEQTKNANGWEGVPWKKVSTRQTYEVLETAEAFDEDIAHPAECSNVITSPLLKITNGKWDDRVLHPRLKENKLPPRAPGDQLKPPAPDRYLLFRYFDFEVKEGTVYRYRIRITFRNPAFEESQVPPEVAKGEMRQSPWSDPSPSVAVGKMKK